MGLIYTHGPIKAENILQLIAKEDGGGGDGEGNGKKKEVEE